LYEEAVDLLLRMRRATAAHDSGCPAFRLAFDEEKLMQEMDFFMTHFVRGLCKREPTGPALRSLEEFFRRICRLLAAEPPIFTHRDYHSRNLIVHRGRLVMVDFQDARMGPAQYDLASLLRDSYVSVPEDLVDELVRRYAIAVGESHPASLDRFRYVFDVMSLQRNIKALGTFGYQLTVRGSSRYLSAIPRTGSYVAHNIALYPEFGDFRSAVEEYVCRPCIELTQVIKG
jgi:aminoglycoside/choline kinase family phosphotransferase